MIMADVSSDTPSQGSADLVALARGIGGALLGAVAGFAIFTLLTRFGLYAIAVSGALVGLTCGWFSQRRSLVLGIVCIVVAALTIIFAEWWNFPFVKDESLGFFLQNLGSVQRLFWLSLLIGGGLAFWFGLGSERTPSSRSS